jgi:S-adenosylmethionine:tRNA ribosyltransferase-isomerase
MVTTALMTQQNSGTKGEHSDSLDFTLPHELEASAPPEARGIARDQIRLIVSDIEHDRFAHTRFARIGDFLDAGDVLVINTSGTMSAALDAARADGTALELRLSTRLVDAARCHSERSEGSQCLDQDWTIELRLRTPDGATQFRDGVAGETIRLPDRGTATLVAPHGRARTKSGVRLWRATLELPLPLDAYLRAYGRPIRYGYVRQTWPPAAYQNVYATAPGSAEMPSAGRGFSEKLITRLVAQGVQIAPLTLDTGVSSLDDDEPPYAERYAVPAATARLVNSARNGGRFGKSRIIAVGTTVVRALETVTDTNGVTHDGEGYTDLVVAPGREVRVDGLLTGFHAPRASHLAMLEAIAGRRHLERAYTEALRERYLWHEFGDAHLMLRSGIMNAV